MTQSCWHFNSLRPSDKVREPVQGEFFATEAISNPGEALVREGIQNSLDAALGDGPVRVRIRISAGGAIGMLGPFQTFFDGLWNHVSARGNGLHDPPGPSEPCAFLAFEDFGTSGLTGDPAEYAPDLGASNHFYHFYRAEGRSSKKYGDRGRWGLGKQVFPRASRINTVFGLTVRSDDNAKLLMGMSVLKSHSLGGTRYSPDGWFGVPPKDESRGLVMPLADAETISAFEKTFDLQRGDKPGLSIVVPWRDLDMDQNALLQAALRGYFWAILLGKLTIRVESDRATVDLNGETLHEELGRQDEKLRREVAPLVELGQWVRRSESTAIPLLGKCDPGRAMKWSDDLFPATELKVLKDKFQRGERVALRVPVNVREKRKGVVESHFDVFMVRDGGDHGGRPVFIREGIIIADVRALRTRGVRALVIADDPGIAGFLGDAENPAHTQWQKDGANFRGKYVSGAADLEFVVRSVHEIVLRFSEEQGAIDRTVLADIFFVPAAIQEQPNIGRNEELTDAAGEEPEEYEMGPIVPAPRMFVIKRSEGGFSIVRGDAALPSHAEIEVRLAYQVRQGNAFAKYHPADFQLEDAPIAVETNGMTLLDLDGNVLQARINADDFRLVVRGFDKRRDLRIRATLKGASHANSNT